MFMTPLPALTINIQVDSLALLSGAPIVESVFIVDSSGSTLGKGLSSLNSVAMPGQRVRWTVTSIDLQAPAWLKRIVFVEHDDVDSLKMFRDASNGVHQPERPARAVSWEGLVPPTAVSGVAYPYHIHLSFGGGVGVPKVVTGSSIEVRGSGRDEPGSTPGASWASQAFATSGGVL